MKEENKAMKIFRIIQLMGDLFDWISLWMLICCRETSKNADKIELMEKC